MKGCLEERGWGLMVLSYDLFPLSVHKYTLRNYGLKKKVLPKELKFYPEPFASEEPFHLKKSVKRSL